MAPQWVRQNTPNEYGGVDQKLKLVGYEILSTMVTAFIVTLTYMVMESVGLDNKTMKGLPLLGVTILEAILVDHLLFGPGPTRVMNLMIRIASCVALMAAAQSRTFGRVDMLEMGRIHKKLQINVEYGSNTDYGVETFAVLCMFVGMLRIMHYVYLLALWGLDEIESSQYTSTVTPYRQPQYD